MTPRTPCGAPRIEQAGQSVDVYGWVHRRRDLGGLIFIDLRDRSGIVQVKFDPVHAQAHATGGELRLETVIHVRGPIVRRPPGTENKELPSGAVEIEAQAVDILNRALPPPFAVNEDGVVDEQLRLRYRYLDLRRQRMARNLQLRHRMAKAIRDFLDDEGFVEIETPVLIRSTPEGARDYLVPSRLKTGHVYALAQSPQLYKQLLMVAGMDRYFQIVRCYRDEDQRADRQPEFTQLDLEMSFVAEDDVLDVVERCFAHVWKQVLGVAVATPIRRITHADAMLRYGVDKPDLRYKLEIEELSSIFAGTEFKIFRQALDAGGVVRGLRIPVTIGGKEIDALTEAARGDGAKGLAFWHREAQGWRSPITKFFTERELVGLEQATGAQPGDVVVAVADRPEVAAAALGSVRKSAARSLGLIDERAFEFVWVTEFPLFERSKETGDVTAAHHPFTSPRPEDVALLASEPMRVRARAYDLVLNGTELGSGSIRIHDPEMQQRVFSGLGMAREDAERRFGFLLDAFRYGAPPHGGFAYGLDRVVMLAAGEQTIREVIAFPKNQQAEEVMTDAPAPADPKQLRELGLELVRPPLKQGR
ncbi:MAG: aspartate--tRNA ligase [Chloroflexi bacterium 13_1_20CM_66_33]|nr:MAG: aspartate--tRNA ligase [Chloroflexi bacterium 13_1_20CM_66_33]TMG14225.1 MAG: aspartate--tRNA ligase [Chloroflexota bacterium]